MDGFYPNGVFIKVSLFIVHESSILRWALVSIWTMFICSSLFLYCSSKDIFFGNFILNVWQKSEKLKTSLFEGKKKEFKLDYLKKKIEEKSIKHKKFAFLPNRLLKCKSGGVEC